MVYIEYIHTYIHTVYIFKQLTILLIGGDLGNFNLTVRGLVKGYTAEFVGMNCLSIVRT